MKWKGGGGALVGMLLGGGGTVVGREGWICMGELVVWNVMGQGGQLMLVNLRMHQESQNLLAGFLHFVLSLSLAAVFTDRRQYLNIELDSRICLD